jgi:hypothetical protein
MLLVMMKLKHWRALPMLDIDDGPTRLTFVQAVEMIKNSHNLGACEELNVHLDRYLRGIALAMQRKQGVIPLYILYQFHK